MTDERPSMTTDKQPSELVELVNRFRSRAAMCRELEQTAVEETRWHDAATMKSHCMIWERAARMAEEAQG